MTLWIAWWNLVRELRPAFSRNRTFLWFAHALAATCTRNDLRGVTSLVRSLGLREACYDRLLAFFHSRGVDLPCLNATDKLLEEILVDAYGEDEQLNGLLIADLRCLDAHAHLGIPVCL